MKKLSLLLVLVVSSGCTGRRYLVIGAASPFEPPLAGLSEDFTWGLGEVHISMSAQNQNGAGGGQIDLEPVKQQMRDRLRATLQSQSSLGARQGPANYSLEINLDASERYGFGREMGLAIGLELGLAALGAGVGALVGLATSRERPPDSTNGYLIGSGAGLAAGLVSATIPRSGGVIGEYKARLVLRRLSDRVPVAERTVESTWRFDFNWYDISEKLAQSSGESFVEFEKVLVPAVRAMVLEAQPAAATP